MKSSDVERIEKVKFKKDIFDIRWRVTTLCNYQCAFCIQGSPEEHARQARGESAELRSSICDKIVSLVESAENLQSFIAQEERRLRVTDIYGKTSYYPTIQALGASLENTDTFCPTGYLCEAGIRNIWIDAFGSVKRCPTIGSTMSMGSILDDTFQLYTCPEICTSDHYSCGVYGKIEKREIKKEKQEEQ